MSQVHSWGTRREGRGQSNNERTPNCTSILIQMFPSHFKEDVPRIDSWWGEEEDSYSIISSPAGTNGFDKTNNFWFGIKFWSPHGSAKPSFPFDTWLWKRQMHVGSPPQLTHVLRAFMALPKLMKDISFCHFHFLARTSSRLLDTMANEIPIPHYPRLLDANQQVETLLKNEQLC